MKIVEKILEAPYYIAGALFGLFLGYIYATIQVMQHVPGLKWLASMIDTLLQQVLSMPLSLRGESPMITAIYILSDPNTTDTLKKVVESTWTGRTSDLEAAAAATVPHLLAVPAAVARLTLRIPDFLNKVPYIQILQDAAAAYTADPGPGFCEHVQQAAAAAAGWLPDGATGGCKNTSFDPCQSLSVDDAIVSLATLPKTVRASISRRYNMKHGDSIPTVQWQAHKRVLWAVHYIPPCHDKIIKMVMHQSENAPVISGVGMGVLRRLAAVYIADPEAYAGDEAVISIEAT